MGKLEGRAVKEAQEAAEKGMAPAAAWFGRKRGEATKTIAWGTRGAPDLAPEPLSIPAKWAAAARARAYAGHRGANLVG